MKGIVVLRNAAGRALRNRRADVRLADVIDVSGQFSANEVVYVSFRGRDGGQYTIATAPCQRDAEWLEQRLGPPTSTGRSCVDADGDELVFAAEQLDLLWPPDAAASDSAD